MTFDPARPRYTLPFGGKDYELIGTMGMIEAIEHRLKKGIGAVAVEVAHGMTASDFVKLLSVILGECGYPQAASEAGSILWSKVGISGEGDALLRLHVYSFLSVCLAPPESREAKAKEMGELIGGLASHGEATRKSASERSGGPRRSSGRRQRGTSQEPTKATA